MQYDEHIKRYHRHRLFDEEQEANRKRWQQQKLKRWRRRNENYEKDPFKYRRLIKLPIRWP